MTLSESMDELAKVLVSCPSDLDIEINIHAKEKIDVPNMFVECAVNTNSTSYRRIIETREGIVTRSIVLSIAD